MECDTFEKLEEVKMKIFKLLALAGVDAAHVVLVKEGVYCAIKMDDKEKFPGQTEVIEAIHDLYIEVSTKERLTRTLKMRATI